MKRISIAVMVLVGSMVMGYLCYYFTGMHPVVCVTLFGTIAVISVAIIGLSRWLSKKWIILWGFLWGGFLIFLFLNPISLFVSMYGSLVAKEKRNMYNPTTYTVVGETLALYCQSYELLRAHGCGTVHSDCVTLHGAWIPKGLDGVGTIQRDGASIGMGGALHDHGLELSLDTKASTAVTNVWKLYYTEGKRESKVNRHLLTIHMDSARQFSTNELLATVVANYDSYALRNPSTHAFQWQNRWGEKIQMYLLFDRITEARTVCREQLVTVPRKWNQWLMLTAALITAEEESFERAEHMMMQWVKEDGNFMSYLVLAYFYQMSDKPSKAAKAIRQATTYDTSPSMGRELYTIAMYVYKSGEYDTVLQICDHASATVANIGNVEKPVFAALHSAVLEAKQNPSNAKPLEWAKSMIPFDPYKDVDIERLLQRPVSRMTVKEWSRLPR